VLIPELVRDVGRSDGAEQRSGRSGLDVEAELDPRKALAYRLRVVEGLRLLPGAPVLDLADLGNSRRCRLVGEAAGEEEVTCVPARDVHDLAAEADLVDVLAQDDFHYRPSAT
jgi:hypothetical protein